MTYKCTFKPGEKPKYSIQWINERTGEEKTVEKDRKTFRNEIEIHGEPDRKYSRIKPGFVVEFFYEYAYPKTMVEHIAYKATLKRELKELNQIQKNLK